MKVVIAGGSGLIGRHLAASLAADGEEVVVLTRAAADDSAWGRHRQVGTRLVSWDPGVPGPWRDELAGASAIVNLAGAGVGRWPWTSARRRVLVESRVTPTRALVDAIAALPDASRPRVLLNASGTDGYEGLDATPATEATPLGNSFLAGLCRAWEREAWRATSLGCRVVLLRTSAVLAPGASYLRTVTLPFRLGIGGPIGSGAQWVSWVAIEDAVGLIRWAIDRPDVAGPLNVTAPDPRQQRDQAAAIGRALGRPARVRVPAWAVRLALGPQATLALGSRRVWPARALELGYRFRVPSLEQALSASLGTTPPSAAGAPAGP